MTAYPLPPAQRIRDMAQGFGRAARIRALYAQRCNPAEIAAWLCISVEEVRRTLHRPVPTHAMAA